DATVEAFAVVPHRVGDAERHELAVHEREERFRFVAGRERNILAEAEQVEAIYEVVVRGVSAGRIAGALEVRTRQCVERPTLGTLLGRRGWPIQLPLHLLRSKLASWPLESTVQTTPLLSTSIPRGAKPCAGALGLFHGTS